METSSTNRKRAGNRTNKNRAGNRTKKNRADNRASNRSSNRSSNKKEILLPIFYIHILGYQNSTSFTSGIPNFYLYVIEVLKAVIKNTASTLKLLTDYFNIEIRFYDNADNIHISKFINDIEDFIVIFRAYNNYKTILEKLLSIYFDNKNWENVKYNIMDRIKFSFFENDDIKGTPYGLFDVNKHLSEEELRKNNYIIIDAAHNFFCNMHDIPFTTIYNDENNKETKNRLNIFYPGFYDSFSKALYKEILPIETLEIIIGKDTFNIDENKRLQVIANIKYANLLIDPKTDKPTNKIEIFYERIFNSKNYNKLYEIFNKIVSSVKCIDPNYGYFNKDNITDEEFLLHKYKCNKCALYGFNNIGITDFKQFDELTPKSENNPGIISPSLYRIYVFTFIMLLNVIYRILNNEYVHMIPATIFMDFVNNKLPLSQPNNFLDHVQDTYETDYDTRFQKLLASDGTFNNQYNFNIMWNDDIDYPEFLEDIIKKTNVEYNRKYKELYLKLINSCSNNEKILNYTKDILEKYSIYNIICEGYEDIKFCILCMQNILNKKCELCSVCSKTYNILLE